MEERLLFHNPWWSDPIRIDSDKNIKAIEKTSIKWRQEKVVHFDLEKDAIYTLRGPRQVGKTTLIKKIIKNLLKNSTKPHAIFYYSFDLERHPEDILRIFQQFLEFSTYSETLPYLHHTRRLAVIGKRSRCCLLQHYQGIY